MVEGKYNLVVQGPNALVYEHRNYSVLFSYGLPVALKINDSTRRPGSIGLRVVFEQADGSMGNFSPTTGRHINRFFEGKGFDAGRVEPVPLAVVKNLLAGGSVQVRGFSRLLKLGT